MSNDTKEYCYSINDEEYYDDLCYVLDMARDDELDTIYEAERTPCKHSDLIDPYLIIEQTQEEAYSLTIEQIADTYLDGLTKEDIEELGKVISNFLDEKLGPPNFYRVQNSRLVSIREFEPVEEDNEENR
jgi:hypothetical protein